MTTTVYLNCNLFQGTSDQVQSDAWMVVNNKTGKLTHVGQGNYSGSADNTVDLKGRYVMPGLVDAHTHMFMNPLTNKLYYLTETEGDPASIGKLTSGVKSWSHLCP